MIKGTDLKGNAVRCCSSPRYCKKDDSFKRADIQRDIVEDVRTGTTVMQDASWEGKEEGDFEPGDLLDRDKQRAF